MRSRAELSRSGNIVRGLCLLAVLLTVSCRDNYPCISGVTEGTTYEMTFTEESAVGNGVGIESCAGLADVDSLMVGSIVDVYVPHGAQRVDDPEDCQAPVGQITSDVGVTLEPPAANPEEPQTNSHGEMFVVNAQVTVKGCQLAWAFEGQADGTLADGKNERAVRFITADGSPTFDTCAAQFPDLTATLAARCEDEWDIGLQTK
jgi:hypothetical protein